MARTHSANAYEAETTAPVTGSDVTVDVDTTAGSPDVPFYLTFRPEDDSNREYWLVTSKTATSFTVDSVAAGRHLEGSAASSGQEHPSGTTVKHVPTAQQFTDLWDRTDKADSPHGDAAHSNSYASDPHGDAAHSNSYAADPHGDAAHSNDYAPKELSRRTAFDTTLQLSDASGVVEMTSSASKTITVPADSSVAFVSGTVVELCLIGAGDITVAAEAGVTLNSPGGLTQITEQYGTATLRKRSTDNWVLEGRLA